MRKLELVKTSWRNKFAQKQGELDALQVSSQCYSFRFPFALPDFLSSPASHPHPFKLQSQHADLASQLSALRGVSRSDSSNALSSANTRNTTLERRLANAQNQLATYDEKMASARSKMSAAEARWDARVKEYESRLKAAEEKIKSEKQGGKERAAQLEGQVR